MCTAKPLQLSPELNIRYLTGISTLHPLFSFEAFKHLYLSTRCFSSTSILQFVISLHYFFCLNVQVPENSGTGYVIGNLSAIDPDNLRVKWQTFTYSMISDAGGRFLLVGNSLQVRAEALFSWLINNFNFFNTFFSTLLPSLKLSLSLSNPLIDRLSKPTASGRRNGGPWLLASFHFGQDWS